MNWPANDAHRSALMTDAPIAFILFNRQHQTRITFEVIRRARPRDLFLIADAPRAGHNGDEERVVRTRQVVEKIDWPCRVRRFYAESNMGCGRRISSGISRAFREVDRLIILEDDCLAEPSFFQFAGTLLHRYANDSRVMAISGDCFHQKFQPTSASYYFSKYPHCWGWATWRRAWRHFRLQIPNWQSFANSTEFAELCDSGKERRYWRYQFDRVARGDVDTWDYQWTLACWRQSGLTAIPTCNLVRNIGFDANSTHTKKANHLANLATYRIDQIRHPDEVQRDRQADRETDNLIFSGPWREPGQVRRLGRSLDWLALGPRWLARGPRWLARGQGSAA